MLGPHFGFERALVLLLFCVLVRPRFSFFMLAPCDSIVVVWWRGRRTQRTTRRVLGIGGCRCAAGLGIENS